MKVYIHGWGFNSTVFKGDGIKLELPGHDNDIKTLREACILYSKHLEKQECLDIIGWSMGASLGIMLTNHLSNIKSLKLIGFSPYFKNAHKHNTLLSFIKTMEKDFTKGIEEFRKNAYPFEFQAKYPNKDIAISILKEYYELDLRDYIKHLSIPISIFQGKYDTITPLQEAYKAKELNNKINIFVYESGHFPKTPIYE